MNAKMTEIKIKDEAGNEIKFIREDCISTIANPVDGLEYGIVRTRMFGVMAGYIAKKTDRTCTIVNGRRIWKFVGAETLEEVAVYGASDVESSRIGPVSPLQEIHEDYAIIYCTNEGKKMIEEAPAWKK